MVTAALDDFIALHPPVVDATPEERVLMGSLIALLRTTRWGRVTVSIEAGLPTRVALDQGWKLR